MTEEKKPFHNPFASLAHLRGTLPEPPQGEAPAKPPPAPSTKSVARAVVRLQRTGRGGKEVTVVEHLDLRDAEREKWLKTLKAALGCGGSVEGDALVLQGDHRERLPKLLSARGVKKVTLG